MHPHVVVFGFIFAIVFLRAFFTPVMEASANNYDDLKKRIGAILKNKSLKDASCGISIVSIKKNMPIFNYRSNDLFGVASNMKLLTTAAALDSLGPDFEYKTYIEAGGTITDSGALKGDIIIRGSGDPNFSGRLYHGHILAVPEAWAVAVMERGIHTITGDIVADDSIFDRRYINPNWPKNQLSEWYCAPSCGLSFNDNCVDITIIPGKKPGMKATLLVEPDTSYFTISNDCICTPHKKEHGYSIYRKPETNQIFIRGKFWINAAPEKRWVSVHNPALYLATVFKEVLEKYGITVYGNVRLIQETDASHAHLERITRTTSTLAQTILVTNKRSQNFYAEQILKTLGARINGSGTVELGIDVVHNFMSKLGFYPDAYQIYDGSGLSRGNKLSPGMITSLLVYMMKHPQGKAFYNSLPISGIDGGLQSRMVSPQYKNRVHAKTGYIAKTSALSGYIETSDNDALAFSILINNFNNLDAVQKIQDAICQTLVDYYN